ERSFATLSTFAPVTRLIAAFEIAALAFRGRWPIATWRIGLAGAIAFFERLSLGARSFAERSFSAFRALDGARLVAALEIARGALAIGG
ncbi:hypothetical protein, partial [Mesorhizobium sp.]|uniref:hypothetical protein n=1 Tax=Mesorhizobium sp. TaxID=1871066 RepID=UPI0034595347